MTELVLLPAFNEAASFPHLLPRFAELRRSRPDLTLLVVNDGSTDETERLLQQFAALHPWIQSIHQEKNRGLTQALRTGIQAAVARLADNDMVITMDADDTHDPAQIPAMLSAMPDADLIIASRFCNDGRTIGLGPVRQALSWGAARLLTAACPVAGVRDYSSGYRAYRVQLLRRLLQVYPDVTGGAAFDCTAELLLRCACIGAAVKEVPLVLRNDRRKRRSHMPIARTIAGYLRRPISMRCPLRARVSHA